MSQDLSIREHIREEILNHPGTYRKQLCRRLGISWGAVSYHIQILKATGVVMEHGHRGRHLLFPDGFPRDARRRASALSGPRRKRLFDILQRDGRQGIQALSKRLGLSREVIRRILEDFQEQGLVRREPGHHGKFMLRNPPQERPVLGNQRHDRKG